MPKSIMDYEFVLANTDTFRIWNFYEAWVLAEFDMPRVNSEHKETYKPMLYRDYAQAENLHYRSKPTIQISRAKFLEMLNVLPPMRWKSGIGYEYFFMSEFYTGTWTTQYVRKGSDDFAQYFEKLVDITDRTTWIIS